MVEGAEVEEGSEPLSGGAFLLRTKPCRFPFLPRIEIPGSTQYGILLADQPATAKGHPEPHVRKQWDVFISYRRLGDSETARLIRGELKARGFRAFLDVEDLGPRYFDEELLEHLDNSTGFIVILSPGSLDKRGASEDWLRREVARALAAQKRIVPIMKDDFQFPPAADLPDDLARLPRHNSVVYSHVHFGAVMDKIVKFLSAAPPRPR
jgi:hypothetical protein